MLPCSPPKSQLHVADDVCICLLLTCWKLCRKRGRSKSGVHWDWMNYEKELTKERQWLQCTFLIVSTLGFTSALFMIYELWSAAGWWTVKVDQRLVVLYTLLTATIDNSHYLGGQGLSMSMFFSVRQQLLVWRFYSSIQCLFPVTSLKDGSSQAC